MRFGFWIMMFGPILYFVLRISILARNILDIKDFKVLIRDTIVCTVLVILTAWSFTRCKNLPYSINNYTYILTEFSEKDGGGYYKYNGGYYKYGQKNISVLVKTEDGYSEIQSVPADTVKFNFSDSEEPSVTISKKEYNLNTLDKIATLDVVEDDGNIEKAVLTIPRE